MLEQFRKYEIKDTRNIFGRNENQFTLDCPGSPRPIHYSNGMAFCLPSPDGGHSNPASADGYFGRAHGDGDGIPPDGVI